MARACGRQGAGGNTRAPDGRHTVARGSASRERNHRAGDHPIPFRTRQLSPTSPKVLRREAAGGQVVPLAGGAFFSFARRFLANKRCQMTSLFLFRMGAGKAHGRSRSFFRGIWRISMGWRAGALRWSFAVRAKAGLPPTVRQGPSASVLGIGAYNAQWKRVDGHGERTREDWFP